MEQPPLNKRKTIMIVDDEPNNLNVLEAMLRQEGGYDVVAFPSGPLALAVVYNDPPDLILLDIRMPGMDGYEVCLRLKSSKNVARIPVLFLSALTDPLDKVKAFELGAVDYIAKPLNEAEVLARVKTHLKLRDYQLDMEEQVRKGAADLYEAHRRLQVWDDAKTQWLGVLSHEMRTPLTGLFGIGDYVFDELPDDSPLKDFKSDYMRARERMLKLVDDAFLLANIKVDSDAFRLSPVRLATAIDEALADVRGDYAEIAVLADPNMMESVRVLANPSLLFRACADLLAVASMSVEQGQKVMVDAAVLECGHVAISFSTNGPQLSSHTLDAFFDVGGQRKMIAPGGDFGLRPALASRIAELFKGSVSVRNGESGGIVLEMVFPVHGEDAGTAQWALLEKAV